MTLFADGLAERCCTNVTPRAPRQHARMIYRRPDPHVRCCSPARHAEKQADTVCLCVCVWISLSSRRGWTLRHALVPSRPRRLRKDDTERAMTQTIHPALGASMAPLVNPCPPTLIEEGRNVSGMGRETLRGDKAMPLEGETQAAPPPHWTVREKADLFCSACGSLLGDARCPVGCLAEELWPHRGAGEAGLARPFACSGGFWAKALGLEGGGACPGWEL
ncbi:hypothetical protein F5X68DRAFT_5579 [Plectosphaerella plurivora]|uniref:Uncharacterized protein n=1 Tax=Plectosphaerella plurivora TaxID=936078 RepID=A0A9P9AHB9_9PEZI|nr:hypothetical protein F5X68DRAFT_5579 [Plectosphaerella plurivora]